MELPLVISAAALYLVTTSDCVYHNTISQPAKREGSGNPAVLKYQ